MKQQTLIELLNEMICRDFDIEETAEVLNDINEYLIARREANRLDKDEDYRESWAESQNRRKKWMLEMLEKYSIELTLDEIEA